MHHSRAFSTALQVTRRLDASNRQLDIAMLMTRSMCCCYRYPPNLGDQITMCGNGPEQRCRRNAVVMKANSEVSQSRMLSSITASNAAACASARMHDALNEEAAS
jgi:hypothetical protein